jgi:hypothetical protein
MLLAKRAAESEGFRNARVDDLSCLGAVTFTEHDLKKGAML